MQIAMKAQAFAQAKPYNLTRANAPVQRVNVTPHKSYSTSPHFSGRGSPIRFLITCIASGSALLMGADECNRQGKGFFSGCEIPLTKDYAFMWGLVGVGGALTTLEVLAGDRQILADSDTPPRDFSQDPDGVIDVNVVDDPDK